MTPSELLKRAGLPDMGEPLHRYLVRQRWFGGRGRAVAGATIEDAGLLLDGSPKLFFVLLDIHYQDGDHEHYNIPLEVHSGTATATPPHGDFRIVQFTDSGVNTTAYDALGGTIFAANLWRWAAATVRLPTCAGGLEFAGNGTEGGGARRDDIRPVGGEQSNTSLVWREQEFLKYVRRVEPGPPIELEMLKALSSQGFSHAPRLLGSIMYHRPAQEPSAVGVVQAFLPAATDGWKLGLHSLSAFLEGPGPPSLCSFAPEAERLGEVTASMHAHLGSPRLEGDMSPVEITRAMLDQWAAEMVDQLDSVLAAGDGSLDGLRRRRPALIESFAALPAAGAGGLAIRTHGDYHLGQVMRTPDQWMVLDFEGEPARPATQRRRRYSPLRDVAGMLRSFDYAAATEVGRRAAAGAASPQDLERAERWARQCRDAFWNGYQRGVYGTTLLSPGGGSLPMRHAWELDKAVYELRYELGHRPEWAGVPLSFLLSGS